MFDKFSILIVDDNELKADNYYSLFRYTEGVEIEVINKDFEKGVIRSVSEIYSKQERIPLVLLDEKLGRIVSGKNIFKKLLNVFPNEGGVVLSISAEPPSKELNQIISENNPKWTYGGPFEGWNDIKRACESHLEGRDGEYRLS
jgi:hypothetical protein